MADTYEQNLSQKGTLTVSDYIRVVGSDNASYKQLVSDVAKKIIENYTGSSLAGSSQSVKSALDALNSKQQIERLSGADANTLTETGMYYVYNGTNVPSGYCIVLVFHPVNVGSFAQVGLAMNSGSSVPIYTRKYDSSTQTYTNWAQI